MSHFLGSVVFVVVASGLILHAGIELPPFLEWVGTLPGDLMIHKGDLTLYIPLTSSVLIGIVLSCLLTALFGKGK